MTVVVAFLCTDGVVVGADSMITPSIGGIGVGHHTGRKIFILPHQQVMGWAGDLGQAMRFRTMAELVSGTAAGRPHALDHGLALSQGITSQFATTNAANVDLGAILAFEHGAQFHCCVFEGNMQPRLLDPHHYYSAFGSGKLSADPFLKFLVDIFCSTHRPTVGEAVFLATWTIQHTIETTQGGVAAPIRIGVLEMANGALAARELPDAEIDEHLQAVGSAQEALRGWRDAIQNGDAAAVAPPVPVPQPGPQANP